MRKLDKYIISSVKIMCCFGDPSFSVYSLSSQPLHTAVLDELTYLLESGSDRIGALDFQHSPSEYKPRSTTNVPLEELLESAARVEKGIPLTPELDLALYHGTAIGGARPKALIEEDNKKYVGEFNRRHNYSPNQADLNTKHL